MGMNDRMSSARPVSNGRQYDNPTPDPIAVPAYEYRRRPNEAVTSVRAVVGPPNERCWLEQERVVESGNSDRNVGGAIAEGVIGSNVGRNSGAAPERQVRRCETVASTVPAYWDVGYSFRGVEHHLQMTKAPGTTVEVNGKGVRRRDRLFA